MGLAFISEGAIPFLKKDKKIEYVFILSSILIALLVVYYDVTSMIAHGGILSIFFIERWFMFVFILFGTSVFSALILGLVLKKEEK
jgi:fructose PTS system EIIBC or EIIC component